MLWYHSSEKSQNLTISITPSKGSLIQHSNQYHKTWHTVKLQGYNRMKNQELIDTYLRHGIHSKPQGNATLSIKNGIVYSYITPIAVFMHGYLYVTTAKYSVTTTRVCDMMENRATAQGIKVRSTDETNMYRHERAMQVAFKGSL